MTLRPLYSSSDLTVCLTTGPECDAKPRKPCHCTRSQCLKLYCECFSSGAMCSGCHCSHCHNNAEHAAQRHTAVQVGGAAHLSHAPVTPSERDEDAARHLHTQRGYLGRNRNAFKPKLAGGETGEVKGRHSRGCNCKRSFCLKNYCECYQL
ncbi:protein lin-54 homolog [Pseudoliparis swirei]|uniref:protein lin-54 homolog n=1 Tax=Pseudoliparis swirei TaxID=2059687 RepID=UPI0024BD749B|nr:protein lin-54 homolog [Pseudoliparis swirei]